MVNTFIVFLLLGAICYVFTTLRKFKEYNVAKANIIGIIEERDKFERNIINYRYKLSFKTKNSTIQTNTYDLHHYTKYKIGNKVNVLYKKDNPTEIRDIMEKHNCLFYILLKVKNTIKK